MHRKVSQLIGIFVSLVWIGIAKPGLSEEKFLIYISQTKGRVEIKRVGETIYRPVSAGELIGLSDQLRLAQGASARVVCGNSVVWIPQTKGEFRVSQGCPAKKPVREQSCRIKPCPAKQGASHCFGGEL